MLTLPNNYQTLNNSNNDNIIQHHQPHIPPSAVASSSGALHYSMCDDSPRSFVSSLRASPPPSPTFAGPWLDFESDDLHQTSVPSPPAEAMQQHTTLYYTLHSREITAQHLTTRTNQLAFLDDFGPLPKVRLDKRSNTLAFLDEFGPLPKVSRHNAPAFSHSSSHIIPLDMPRVTSNRPARNLGPTAEGLQVAQTVQGSCWPSQPAGSSETSVRNSFPEH